MSDVLFTTLVIITILLIISSIVLSIMARQAAEKDCTSTNESASYSTYSAITTGVSLILVSIALLIFFFACPSKCPVAPKDDTRELVAKATAALQKHANELKIHADVLNDAFGKVNTISKELSTTCKDTGNVCPVQQTQQAWQGGGQQGFRFPAANKQWRAGSPMILNTQLPQTNIAG